MGKYGCFIGYWWIIFNVVIISYLQSSHSKTSSYLFVDGKGYSSSGSSSQSTRFGKSGSTGVWWCFYACGGGQRYNNNNSNNIIYANSNRRTTTTTNTTTSSDGTTTTPNTDNTTSENSKAAKASTIMKWIFYGILVLFWWIIPCCIFLKRYVKRIQNRKFDKRNIVLDDEPASGIYIVEYIESSSHSNNNNTTSSLIYQEISLNFVKNYNGSYTITGQGFDHSIGLYDIRNGYASRLYTGFTTWEEYSKSNNNPDQVVFINGTFDFTNHSFKGTRTMKNGNSIEYKYFYHKTLGNNNISLDSGTSSSNDTTNNQNPPDVPPNDVVVINNNNNKSNTNDHISTSTRSEAVTIEISLDDSIISNCIG